VSGVVSESMFRFIVRGGESIGVPTPLFHDSDKVGPVYVVGIPGSSGSFTAARRVFASTDRNRPA
jgi:hypothetical protein